MEKRRSDRKYVRVGILLSCILLLFASADLDASEPAGQAPQNSQAIAATPPNEITVALKEIPVWEIADERIREAFLRGQYAPVHPVEKEKLLGMKFVSDVPLYGQVSFPRPVSGLGGSKYFYFALDTSRQGGAYDLLYFNDHGGADLSDEKPRKLAPQSDRLIRHVSSVKEMFFEPFTATFRPGSGGPQTLELLPCLRIYEGGSPRVSFIPARVHTGTFELGGSSYQAFVGYQYTIGGGFDQPSTALILSSRGGEPAMWSGGEQLSATHLLGGRYCRFACTPAGDKLTVQPYAGPLGTFEISSSGRKGSTITMAGSLRTATTAVRVGAEPSADRPPEPARSCKLPVGDYRIINLFIHVDGLQALILSNYHADGKLLGNLHRQDTYAITIREDKPFVLAFSDEAQVLFASPARDQRVRLGQELNIQAVLIDPALNVVFRMLIHEHQLDPKVTITRANGAIVAESVMPFG